MIAREQVLAMTETGATATDSTAGRVTWSFAVVPAASTQHPPPGTSSAAGMDVVPGPMIIVQRYEYTGRELASESNEYYFRYRVYGPSLGQFFTRDPLGYVDGMGLYGGWFAINLAKDPTGEKDTWLLSFVYMQNGQLREIEDGKTDESSIDIEFNQPDREGESNIRYRDAAWTVSGQSGSGETAPKNHCCVIRMQLYVALPANYKAVNFSFAKPKVPTTVMYQAHMTSPEEEGNISVQPDSDELRGYIMRAHERGHAKGWLLLIRQALRANLRSEIKSKEGRIMDACAAQRFNEVEKMVGNAFILAKVGLDRKVLLPPADAATEGLFRNNKDWEEGPPNQSHPTLGPIRQWHTTR